MAAALVASDRVAAREEDARAFMVIQQWAVEDRA
jgi:hypothetical protein